MKLKVWTMVPGRTFDGEYFIFRTRGKNYGQALSAAITYCEENKGFKPEKVELYELEEVQEEQNPQQNNRWSQLSERIQKNPPLRDAGEYIMKSSKEFREDFALSHDEG